MAQTVQKSSQKIVAQARATAPAHPHGARRRLPEADVRTATAAEGLSSRLVLRVEIDGRLPRRGIPRSLGLGARGLAHALDLVLVEHGGAAAGLGGAAAHRVPRAAGDTRGYV